MMLSFFTLNRKLLILVLFIATICVILIHKTAKVDRIDLVSIHDELGTRTNIRTVVPKTLANFTSRGVQEEIGEFLEVGPERSVKSDLINIEENLPDSTTTVEGQEKSEETGTLIRDLKEKLDRVQPDLLEDVDDERELVRLRRSPYVYNRERMVERLLKPSLSDRTMLISDYQPWDDQRNSQKTFMYCPVHKNCKYTTDMTTADAVLFRASTLKRYGVPTSKRPAGQRWVMYTVDPASKIYDLERESVQDVFNWTATYQTWADIWRPFGFLKRQQLPDKNFKTLVAHKKKLIAWIVSHCDVLSKRTAYVARMHTIVPVDIFGRCGNMTCGVNHFVTPPALSLGKSEAERQDSEMCFPMLSRDYNFCEDYVTEKFFKLFHDVAIIPVVRGGFDYKRYIPRDIYVNSEDFETPEDLAKYLIDLGNDEVRYTKMLMEKLRWTLITPPTLPCDVCEKLHTSQGFSNHKSIKDWFHGNPLSCWNT